MMVGDDDEVLKMRILLLNNL